MTTDSKKKLIAGLLFISCVAATWLLISLPSTQHKHLHSLSQADSLLFVTLSEFHVPKDDVSTRSIKVDSAFTRTVDVVTVPSNFPQTRFHLALKNECSPYQISLPARVIFPEKNLNILFDYHHTIINTVKLRIPEKHN
ncbi:MAG TPA: hypothetical protein VE868_07470 [Balneolaceae bacterium]|nr:hypothetical protein [Balneolaceae bacterium]